MKYLKPHKLFEYKSKISIDVYIDKIKKDCKPYIQLMKKELGKEIDFWLEDIQNFLYLNENDKVGVDDIGLYYLKDKSLEYMWDVDKFHFIKERGPFYKSPFKFRGFGEGGSAGPGFRSGTWGNIPYSGDMKRPDFFEKDYSDRVNRSPLDTPKSVRYLLDKYFYIVFGKRLRTKGVFTGNFMLAKGYGEPYLFFPTGNFDYYWNPKITDLFNSIRDEEWYDDIAMVDIDRESLRSVDSTYMELAKNDVEKLVRNYKKNEGLSETAEWSGEVIFMCGKHYLLNANTRSIKDYYKLIKTLFQEQ